MKMFLVVLFTLVLLAVAVIAGIPFLTKVVGPNLLEVHAPSGDPIGEFDFPKPETSILALKLELPIETLAAAANKHAPRELGGDDKKNIHKRVKNGTIQWKMVPGKIALKNTGQSIGFTVPVKGVAKTGGEIDARIVKVPIAGSADLVGTISGTMEPKINKSWQVNPQLDPELSLSRADITLGNIGTFSARRLLEDLANPIIKREAAKLVPEVRKELDLKKHIQKLWNQAHVVEKVNDDPGAWIVFDPERIMMGPIDYSEPASVSVTLGMKAKSFVTNREVGAPPREALPNLRNVEENPVNDIRIPLVADIEELNKTLAGETFSIDTGIGAEVEVTEPSVEVGRGGFLNLSLNLEARSGKWGRGISGRIWVEAKPIVDFEKQTLGFSEVKLTVETKEALSKTAVWLLEELIVKSIERELRADLNDYLPELHEEIDKFLKSGALPEDIKLTVNNPEVKLLSVYTITRTGENSEPSPGIVVVLGGKGHISARLSNF